MAQTMVSRDTGRDAERDAEYELGELELSPRKTRARVATTPQSPVDEQDAYDELPTLASFKPSLPMNDFDLEFERESLPRAPDATDSYRDDEPSGLALELDLPSAPAIADSATAPLRPSAATPASSGRPRAISVSPGPEEERATEELAAYGPPPAGFMASAAYVVRVAQRGLALYRERRALEVRAAERADAYEAALDALGRALLTDVRVRSHEGLHSELAEVEAKQRAHQAAETASHDARAREEQALLALKTARAALERELSPFRTEEQRAEEQHRQLDTELKRKEAQVKRAEIELRALTGASTPPPAERLGSIESERAERIAELATLTARRAESSAALARARRELALRRGGLEALERQQAQHTAKSRSLHGHLDRELSAAERALRVALCALAEAADRLEVPHAAADEIETVREHEAALDGLVEQLARYDRALALYDREGLVRGALVWGLMALTLLLVVRFV